MAKQTADIGQEFDVVIIGGGPAGLSAAIWCSDLGLSAILIESRAELGGNLLNIFNPIENYPGVSTRNGSELRDLIAVQAERSTTLMHLSSEVVSVHPQTLTVDLASGTRLNARNVVIATGVRRRKLGVPGENEFAGRGILESGARSPEAATGKRVVIIGGGDAAMENAVILSQFAEQIHVVYRGERLSARSGFIDAARQASNVEIHLNRSVTEIVGDRAVKAVEVENAQTLERTRIPAELVLCRIGVEPRSEIISGLVSIDKRGYIIVNELGETSLPSIYAIGDVSNPLSPTIASAVGQGATVAKVIREQSAKN